MKVNTIAMASGSQFVALENSKGKVTKTAERQAEVLNALTRAALLGVALQGKGTLRKRAAAVFAADAVVLQDYIDAANDGVAIDGSRWGEFRGILVSELGATNMTGKKGKLGCVEVCTSAILACQKMVLHADTEKAIKAATLRLYRAQQAEDAVNRLLELATEAELRAAREDQDEQDEHDRTMAERNQKESEQT